MKVLKEIFSTKQKDQQMKEQIPMYIIIVNGVMVNSNVFSYCFLSIYNLRWFLFGLSMVFLSIFFHLDWRWIERVDNVIKYQFYISKRDKPMEAENIKSTNIGTDLLNGK